MSLLNAALLVSELAHVWQQNLLPTLDAAHRLIKRSYCWKHWKTIFPIRPPVGPICHRNFLKWGGKLHLHALIGALDLESSLYLAFPSPPAHIYSLISPLFCHSTCSMVLHCHCQVTFSFSLFFRFIFFSLMKLYSSL